RSCLRRQATRSFICLSIPATNGGGGVNLFQCLLCTLIGLINLIIKPTVFEYFTHGVVKVPCNHQIPEPSPLVNRLRGEGAYTDGVALGNILYIMPETGWHE